MADHDQQDHDSQERVLSLDIDALEEAFSFLEGVDDSFEEEQTFVFLDLQTGKVIWAEGTEEAESCLENEHLRELPDDLGEDMGYRDMQDFIGTLDDDSLAQELAKAIRGSGAFRRFRDIVLGSGNVALSYAWDWFETRKKRERIVEWLEYSGIAPQWTSDIFQAPPLPDKRGDLLQAVPEFVRDARSLPGVRRIALLGSLTTDKAIPKDLDLLVEVDDSEPLGKLAKLSRQLSGRAMATGDNCGADVFLCNPNGEYLGRICPWKKCAPGARDSCPARHCGRRPFLCDDLHDVNLDPQLVAAPPVELWPAKIERQELPDDVRRDLLDQLD